MKNLGAMLPFFILKELGQELIPAHIHN